MKGLLSMPGVYEYLFAVLEETHRIRWSTVQANQTGCPQERARVFIWCVRKDIAASDGMELACVDKVSRADLEALVQEPWNGTEPGVGQRLIVTKTKKSAARWSMLGNLARGVPSPPPTASLQRLTPVPSSCAFLT